MLKSRMKPLLVLVTGEPVPGAREARGDFPAFIVRASGVGGQLGWRSIDARTTNVFPLPHEVSGVVVTGSPESLCEPRPWMGDAAQYLRALVTAEVPVLGICFGHQLLGAALGGRVARNPKGRELGTVSFQLAQADPVVGEAGSFPVNASHSDSVVELPRGARLLGRSALEPHAAVQFSPRTWGVQFHPEIDREILCHYIQARAADLEQKGLNPAELLNQCADTPESARVLTRFVRFVQGLADSH
jgi:GMP synthase (glutamine-hydrolysing)